MFGVSRCFPCSLRYIFIHMSCVTYVYNTSICVFICLFKSISLYCYGIVQLHQLHAFCPKVWLVDAPWTMDPLVPWWDILGTITPGSEIIPETYL